MSRLFLLGVATRGLTMAQQEILAHCGLVVGSPRHLQLVSDLPAERLAITPLTPALEAIRQRLPTMKVAVLASGDPLFFGIGRRLLAEFGPEEVEVLPALSVMQETFARCKLPWDDAALVSLHGRAPLHLPGLLLRRPKTFVFTDPYQPPDRLARLLLDYLELLEAPELLAGCRLQVAAALGSPEEQLVSGSLAEIAARTFAEPNVLLLTRPAGQVSHTGSFGLTAGEISHSRGLITKDEVRAVTLHKLRLPATGVFWDIGAGSGSISLEAARLCPELTVYAVERRKEELARVKDNIRRFGCFNVVPVPGEAPAPLKELPDPDAVFIGGSGGRLSEIIAAVAARMAAGGRVVVNGVTERTVAETPSLLAQYGLHVELSRVEVTRTIFAENGGAAKVLNPITVMTGRK